MTLECAHTLIHYMDHWDFEYNDITSRKKIWYAVRSQNNSQKHTYSHYELFIKIRTIKAIIALSNLWQVVRVQNRISLIICVFHLLMYHFPIISSDNWECIIYTKF
jgi:hypothetical protein